MNFGHQWDNQESIDLSKDFQNKYVGYVLLSLVLGVVGIGVTGLVYFAITGGY